MKGHVQPTTTIDGVDMITYTWGGFHWLRVKLRVKGQMWLTTEWMV